MSHQGSLHGQPSPPLSTHDDYPQAEYNHSHVSSTIQRPYTPPASHPVQAFSYGDPEEYEMRHTPEYYEQPTFYREGAYRTPPQPIINHGIRTRSGRSLGTPEASASPSSRMSQSPRPRRKAKGAKAGAVEASVTEAFSTMTKNWDVPVTDMTAWVNRPAEQRYAEVEKKKKIPRPMNSFMLYRMAYKARIKKWMAQGGDNNQVISSVGGASWRLESKEVKDDFAKLSIVERDNHSAAFPDYKFAPNKNTKKRDRDDDESDGEWEGGSSYSGKRRRGHYDRDVTRSRSTTPAQGMYSSPQYHPASYQTSNPHLAQGMVSYDGWPQPPQYGQSYQYDQFAYHRQPHPLQQYAPTSVPATHDQYLSQQLVGLPPTTEALMEGEMVGRAEFAIDPGLGDFAPPASYQYGGFEEDGYGHERQQVYVGGAEPAVHPGLQTLAPAEGSWSPSGGYAENVFDRELNA